MKKILITVLAITLFIVGCTTTTPPEVKPEFQLVDINEVENEELSSWYQEEKGTLGIYQLESEEAIYLLIAAGEKTTGGYDLELIDPVLEGNTFSGELHLKVPSEDEMTTMALTYPTLLFKFTGLEELNVDLDLALLEEAGSYKVLEQVIAIYNGLIDNNSIEIDTSMSAQLHPFVGEEQIAVLRINQEQLEKVKDLSQGEFLVFDTYQDEHDRLILENLLEIGISEKSYTISAIYGGRMDSNSIEVKINSTGVAFRYTVDKEQEDIGELEPETAINICYKFNEHGQRVAEKISKVE